MSIIKKNSGSQRVGAEAGGRAGGGWRGGRDAEIRSKVLKKICPMTTNWYHKVSFDLKKGRISALFEKTGLPTEAGVVPQGTAAFLT